MQSLPQSFSLGINGREPGAHQSTAVINYPAGGGLASPATPPLTLNFSGAQQVGQSINCSLAMIFTAIGRVQIVTSTGQIIKLGNGSNCIGQLILLAPNPITFTISALTNNSSLAVSLDNQIPLQYLENY